MNTKRLQNIKESFKIAFIYFVAGVLWIMLSDLLLSLFVDDPHKITLFQTYKGWFYILATTVILFFLTQHYFKMMHQQYLQIISEIQKHEQYLLESKEKFYKLSHIDQL
ncbi:MAG: hypothetical protein PHC74_07650, partial [Sulfurimonas sp.]|nr:hypothetical protein [Sulfurimonas sp.]